MAILPVTRELLDRYETAPQAVTWEWESAAVGIVRRYGSRADAEALFGAFLEDPVARDGLIPVFAEHGDMSMAERMLAACTEGGRLRDGMPEDVLHAVGYLGYGPAEQLLWQYVEIPDPAGKLPTFGVAEACLGLLHLPCQDLRGEIAQALGRHVGASLFPEFLPALAVKTGDPSWLGMLLAWGEVAASTDCNGGLILGVALHGERAREEFIELLWNPQWEAGSGATGASFWAYAGARVLGLGMAELYDSLTVQLNSDVDTKVKRYCLKVFAALLDRWAHRPWLGLRMASDPVETYEQLCDLLFTWSTPHKDDALLGLAGQVLHHEDRVMTDLYRLEKQLWLQTSHQLELQAAMSR